MSLELMKHLGLPLTRDAAISLEWLGDPPDPWTPEAEAVLPEELQDWSLFESVDDTLRLKK